MTRKIQKEMFLGFLVLIVIFILLTTRFFGMAFFLTLYILANNPLSRPKIKDEENDLWCIEKRQHSLLLGITGHNYLALRDNKNKIVAEFHGLVVDSKTKKPAEISFRSTDFLKFFEFSLENNYKKELKKHKLKRFFSTGRFLYYGSKDEVLKKWNKGKNIGEKINKQIIHYPSFGFNIFKKTTNSNSVCFTLIKYIPLHDVEPFGLITPGDNFDLLKSPDF